MEKKNTGFIIIVTCIVILLISLAAVIYYVLPWLAIFSDFLNEKNIPEPSITYGEFAIKIEYKLNGKDMILEDVIICEYDGKETIGVAGTYRKWKTRLKSGRERLTLLDLRDQKIVDEWGDEVLEFFFYFGNGEYYMGDSEKSRQRGPNFDAKMVDYLKNVNGKEAYSAMSKEDVLEKYNLSIISCQISKPIKNTLR